MPETASIFRFASIVLMIFFAAGCDSKNDSRQDSAPTAPAPVSTHRDEGAAVNRPAAASSATFTTVLFAWQQGRKEDAAAAFLSLDWKNADLLQGHPCLLLSERQFTALRPSEQQSLSSEALDVSKSIREMTQFLVEQAKTARAENRPQDAARYHLALTQFGTLLSGDDKLHLIQMVGKAVLGYTQKELGQL